MPLPEPVMEIEKTRRKPLSQVKIGETSRFADPYDYISYDDRGPLLYLDETDQSIIQITEMLDRADIPYIIMPPKGKLPRIEFNHKEYLGLAGIRRFTDEYKTKNRNHQNLTPAMFIDHRRHYTGPLE